jgi:hypothetical protein
MMSKRPTINLSEAKAVHPTHYEWITYANELEADNRMHIANGVALNKELDRYKWIPVDIDLPDREGDYLVIVQEPDSHSDLGICPYITDDFTDVLGWVVNHVTHWMPLPEAPHED